MMDTELRLRVGSFEGPFDLLLHLCRTNEIDLAALPVRTITDQYLAHLEAVEFRDLETAGAYLVMAATLIYLKSKLLVPPDDREYCATNCRNAGFGCLDCKEILLKHMIPPLQKIRERRQQFIEKPDRIVEILHEGSRRARAVAGRTMEEVRSAVHLTP